MTRDSTRAQLGFGLAAIGRPAYITLGREADLPTDRSVPALRARAQALLDTAARLGIDYVDAARGYGAAEEFLASWLVTTTARPFVASKWGYRYTAGWRADATRHEEKDHSAAMFAAQYAETHALLSRWLRLYQVHSLTLDSSLWTDTSLHRKLAALRTDGVELGFTTSGAAQPEAIRRGLALTVDGEPLFTSVQATWNLLEPSAGTALAEAAGSGARVIVKEVLGNGRLLASPAVIEAAKAIGVGPDVFATASALAQPWASVVLSGAVTHDQLENSAAARPLADHAALADAGSAVRPVPPAQYWAGRAALAWN